MEKVKALRVLAGCLGVLGLLTLTAVSSASAETPKLAITLNGSLYAGPNQTQITLQVGPLVASRCSQTYLATNTTDKPKVLDTLEGLEEGAFQGCVQGAGEPEPAPYSLERTITKLTLRSNGLVQATSDLALTTPSGLCHYRFKKLTATLSLGAAPEPVLATGIASGIIIGDESNLFCAPVITKPWQMTMGLKAGGNFMPLSAEPRG